MSIQLYLEGVLLGGRRFCPGCIRPTGFIAPNAIKLTLAFDAGDLACDNALQPMVAANAVD